MFGKNSKMGQCSKKCVTTRQKAASKATNVEASNEAKGCSSKTSSNAKNSTKSSTSAKAKTSSNAKNCK